MRYLIRETRHYFAGSIPAYPRKSFYLDSEGLPTYLRSSLYVKPFKSRAEAVTALRKMEAEQVVLSNGESRRPTLSVVPETKWPAYV